MKRIVSNLIVLFIALTTLVIFFEFVLLVTSLDKNANFANTKDFQTKYVIPNSHGYRDKEYSYEKPKNIFRILVLGDSQTFGHGIKNLEDTWHKKLEVLMNQGLESQRFEVISLAGEGWNTDTQLYELFKNGFNYNPDLILLAFYENDVPIPHEFKCQSADLHFLPYSKASTWVRNNSKVYQFIEFRTNRLLERLEQKPTYSECINQRFDSRGWDMEEIYLDIILMSSQIKNIHFMLTTIPLIYKLDEKYPIKSPHEKVKKYCNKKEILCLDLYDEGFKGLHHSKLTVSETDNHLNEEGTEVVAQTLYKKLQYLKKYKNLSKFNGAFDLNELLDQKQIIKELDKRFKEIEEKIKINGENEELKVFNQGKSFQYIKTISKNTKTTIYKIKLDTKGNFIESEVNYYKKNNPIFFYEHNKNLNGKHLLISGVKSKKNGFKTYNEINKRTERLFLGSFKAFDFKKEIVLFKGISFVDPKVIEKGFFRRIGTGPKNENRMLKALNFFKEFHYKNSTFKVYFRKICNEILKTKPSIAAIRAVNRIKSDK